MSTRRTIRPLVGIVVGLLAATAGVSGQTTWYVDDDASTDGDGTSWATAYRSLQAALGGAGPGDEIWVAEGVYRPYEDDVNTNGTVHRFASFQLATGVAVYGGFEGTESLLEERAGLFDQTILSGDLLGDDGPDFASNDENSYHVVTASGVDDTARLDGFTVTGGNADGQAAEDQRGGGIFNSAASPALLHCTFRGDAALYGGGMYNVGNSNPTVTACMFTDNTASSNGGGMYNFGYSSPTVTACTFSDNAAGGGGGGMCNYNDSSPTVTASTFTNNTSGNYGGGMYNFGYSSPAVTACTFSDNTADGGGGGMCNDNDSSPMVTACTLTNNSSSSVGGGIRNYVNGNATIADCTFEGNTASSGGAVQCDSNSHPLIAGCQFLDNTVTGGTASLTGLGGAVSCEGGSNPEVTGCTFQGNTANGGTVGDTGFGGAVWCDGATNAVFRNCLFRDNRAMETTGFSGWGGAVYLYESQASVERCTFVGNTADQAGGAVSNAVYSSLVLDDCLFVDNLAHWSGALWNGHSPCEMTRCKFVGNRAAWISTVRGLPGYTGAINGAWDESIVELANCLVAGNTSRYAGGIDVTASAVLRLANSSVVHNSAEYSAGGIFNENRSGSAQVHVENSIVWGNWPDQIVTLSGCTTTVAYSCIEGGHDGPGNIADDPQGIGGPSGWWSLNATYDPDTGQTTFTDTLAGWMPGKLVGDTLNPDTAQYRQSLIVANTATTITVWGDFTALAVPGLTYQIRDYHLSPDSPCIDAGSNGLLPPDTLDLNANGDTSEPLPFDLDGHVRILCSTVDMGPYEFGIGDYDCDGDVDLDDFLNWDACMAGPDSGPYATGCEAFDFEFDGDVDLEDFGGFQQLFAGP